MRFSASNSFGKPDAYGSTTFVLRGEAHGAHRGPFNWIVNVIPNQLPRSTRDMKGEEAHAKFCFEARALFCAEEEISPVEDTHRGTGCARIVLTQCPSDINNPRKAGRRTVRIGFPSLRSEETEHNPDSTYLVRLEGPPWSELCANYLFDAPLPSTCLSSSTPANLCSKPKLCFEAREEKVPALCEG
ncbi:hypothetical protein B0H16DRAFT_1470160 [Mycena metata]|uniref:Uncharacterized protein n=1 Tax=Mycena metata TaxID=1033252 RepID=A0AAD7MQZ2_9AGAR|nr:hypothetical protein B0H16DRAFT_1470160 [Mycena metata]